MNEKNKNELVIYNTNNPKLFTVVHARDGRILSTEQFEIICEACKNGPFLAFFNEPDNGEIYRIRGPYQGLNKFYVIDRTGLEIHQPDKTVKELKAAIRRIHQPKQ